MSLGKRATPRRTGTRGDWDQTPDTRTEKPPAERKKRKPLKAVSDKTAARKPERDAIEVGNVCALVALGGCNGRIDKHEMVRRGQMKESPYIPALVIPLCRFHHSTVDLYRLAAERNGIRIPRHVWDADGMIAVNETIRLRALRGLGTPYWWATP